MATKTAASSRAARFPALLLLSHHIVTIYCSNTFTSLQIAIAVCCIVCLMVVFFEASSASDSGWKNRNTENLLKRERTRIQEIFFGKTVRYYKMKLINYLSLIFIV